MALFFVVKAVANVVLSVLIEVLAIASPSAMAVLMLVVVCCYLFESTVENDGKLVAVVNAGRLGEETIIGCEGQE